MNRTKQIIISLIVSFWLMLIAVFSIQNIALVSLQFFWLESIKIPVGVLLSFMIAFGFIVGGILPAFFSSNQSQKKPNKSNQTKRTNKEFKRDYEEEKDPLFDWD